MTFDVPSNLIPIRITQLPTAPTADLNSLVIVVVNGQNYSIRIGDLLAAAGSVSSVGLSGGTTGLTVTGSPVTSTGTMTLGGTLAIASGGTGADNATLARANLLAAASGVNSDITGMTGISGGISTPDFIDLDTTAAPASAVGRIAWDATFGVPQVGLRGGNVSADLGLQMFAYVRNAQGAPLTKGQAVYLYQATGNRASVRLAQNTGDATSAKTLGLVAENIATNGDGFVITQGVLDGINTGAFNEGDTVYLGATAGSLTATKPYAPNHLVYIGVVERANAGNGQIYVRPQNGYELDELHDVAVLNPTNGQTITYNSTSGLWEKTNQAALSVGSAINLAGGSANQISYQTGAGATSFVAAPTISSTFLQWTGSAFAWSTTGAGTVTSVSGTGTVNGITLSGTITSSGSLTLGGALSGVSLTTQVSGTLPIANGGSGQTSAQAAMNAFAGAVTSGQYLRGNGTNVVMSAIQAADVPTLNQNTTGSAGSVTSAVTFTNTGGAVAGTTFNGSAARTIDYSTVGAPKADGTGASGTWGISVSGNAATATTATSATTATNLAGGAASNIPYQTGAGATAFLANGTAGQVLRSNGASAPAWGALDGGTF